MLWNGEFITSASEVEGYLQRHMEHANVPPVILDGDPCKQSCYLSLDLADISNETKTVLGMEIKNGGDDILEIHYFSVDDAYRGRDIGVIGFKSLLGLARERNAKYIDLIDVRRDGPGFWSSLGAKPREVPEKLAKTIRHFLKAKRSRMPSVVRTELHTIAEVAQEDPHLGWSLLSQSDHKVPDGNNGKMRYFKSIVFDALCLRDDLRIDLTDSETLTVLEKRLGAIPDFQLAPQASCRVQNRPLAASLGTSTPLVL